MTRRMPWVFPASYTFFAQHWKNDLTANTKRGPQSAASLPISYNLKQAYSWLVDEKTHVNVANFVGIVLNRV